MSRGRHAKPSSLPSASTLAAAAPAALVVAAVAAPAAHPAGLPAARPDTSPAAARAASPFAAAQARRAAAAARQAHPAATAAVITVRPGDTFTSLARRHYGHASRWPVIWWANRHRVHNPNLLRGPAPDAADRPRRRPARW
jgi:nucleoid-associated protein YgaU